MTTFNSTILTLSTGKEIQTYGIVGLSFDPSQVGGIQLFYGSDGCLSTQLDNDYVAALASGDELTKRECAELADFMIAKWSDFKAKAEDKT